MASRAHATGPALYAAHAAEPPGRTGDTPARPRAKPRRNAARPRTGGTRTRRPAAAALHRTDIDRMSSRALLVRYATYSDCLAERWPRSAPRTHRRAYQSLR